mmetsp:Transcript_16316/g.23914  ORF Transcript_16316/g.23914 Transcript_16316/m.23914 type:complete len:173 (+) Transcript_16316:885-1403(+)
MLFKIMIGRGVSEGMRKLMNVNDESAEVSLNEIRSVFDLVSDKLSDGREYIFDEKENKAGFTAADLSFAALVGPLLAPKEMLALNMDRNLMPPKLLSVSDELRSTRAGQHALTMYHKHRFGTGVRPRTGSNCALGMPLVIPKSIGRNRVPWAACSIVAGLTGTAVAILQSKQ